mmetsp:Transcript_29728/g.68241  ORF Transcript_29728/g.68241 Transcript_29728/m.68241 type:complete len:384 (-) Transcript_29728:303-1454(-)
MVQKLMHYQNCRIPKLTQLRKKNVAIEKIEMNYSVYSDISASVMTEKEPFIPGNKGFWVAKNDQSDMDLSSFDEQPRIKVGYADQKDDFDKNYDQFLKNCNILSHEPDVQTDPRTPMGVFSRQRNEFINHANSELSSNLSLLKDYFRDSLSSFQNRSQDGSMIDKNETLSSLGESKSSFVLTERNSMDTTLPEDLISEDSSWSRKKMYSKSFVGKNSSMGESIVMHENLPKQLTKKLFTKKGERNMKVDILSNKVSEDIEKTNCYTCGDFYNDFTGEISFDEDSVDISRDDLNVSSNLSNTFTGETEWDNDTKTELSFSHNKPPIEAMKEKKYSKTRQTPFEDFVAKKVYGANKHNHMYKEPIDDTVQEVIHRGDLRKKNSFI